MRPVTDARIGKRIERKLRTIPVDAIAPDITAHESNRSGLWCLVAGLVKWVPKNGAKVETAICDDLCHAQYARWLVAHPERVHETHEAAVAFVRAKLASDALQGNEPESAGRLSDSDSN